MPARTRRPRGPGDPRGRACPWDHPRGVLLACALLSACAHERGKAWGRPVPTADAAVPEVSLVLLGDVGARGGAGTIVAAELERVLTDRRRRGRPSVVVWLGDNIGPVGPGDLGHCTHKDRAWERRGPAALVAVVRAHVAAGGAVLATLGEQDWSCGQPELELQSTSGPHPWVMPAHNYVARVYPDGQVHIAMSCAAGRCDVRPTPDAPLVELVVVDSPAWFTPPPEGTPAAARADESLAEQRLLLSALASQPAAAPRLLVSHHPLESAGPHGVGGRYSDSGFAFHHEPVRQAVDAGLFAGALSAHDRLVLAAADVTDATKRSSRTWLKHPVFQVISGAASRPDARAGMRGWYYFQSTVLRGDLQSSLPGFAELQVRGDGFRAVLHRRRAGRWAAGALEIPRDRPPHPVESKSPVMDPCLDCDPVPPRPY